MRLWWAPALVVVSVCFLSGEADGLCAAGTEWSCASSGACIPIVKRNNGVNDCYDHSDEVSFSCVKNDSFHCSEGSCIPLSWRLDGDRDCGNGIDEGKIIGTYCNSTWYGPCDQFIPNSYCDRNTSTCHCLLGYLHTDLLSACHKRILKDPCTVDGDCSHAVQNSYCNQGNCTCLSGYYDGDNGTSCTKRVLRDTCGSTADCADAMTYSDCYRGVCLCNILYIPNWNATGCRVRLLGDPCTQSVQCTTGMANTVCDSSMNQCKCSAGWLTEEGTNDRCRRRILAQDSCTTDSDCTPGVPNSRCVGGKCVCDVSYYIDSGNTTCVMRRIYDTCASLAQCGGILHSTCGAAAVCVCLRGYLVNTARDTCTRIKIGDPCTGSEDCTGSVMNSYCLPNNTCACSIGYLPSDNKSVCNPRRLGIDPCILEVDCSGVANSNCTDGKCTCSYGYRVSSVSNIMCEQLVMGISVCTVDSECSNFFLDSVCEGGVCACKRGHTVKGGVCGRRNLGDACAASDDCESVVTNSICYEGTCLCMAGWTKQSFTSCRQRVLGVDLCVRDTDCTAGIPNSICHSNQTCVCGPGYQTPNNYICLSLGQSTDLGCTDFASCKPWAIALIIVFLLLPPIITGVVMLTYKNIQDRKSRLLRDKRKRYGRSDPMRDLGMTAIPTITNFTAPRDTALHNLPEIAGLIIRDKSFFKEVRAFTSASDYPVKMSKVDV